MLMEAKTRDLLTSTSTKAAPYRPTQAEIKIFRAWFEEMLKGSDRITSAVHPWQAEIMLEKNTGNRTLSMVRAMRYAKDMKAKAWEETGEPIIFSDADILNDGQTRLKACVLAGVPFTTHITFGVPRRAFRMTGVGGKRTLADVLSIAGEVNTTTLAGSLNWLRKFENGFSSPPLTHNEGLELLIDHPQIRDSVSPGTMTSKKTHFFDPSLAISLHYVFALKDKDQADAFFEYLTLGIGVDNEKDTRYKLRQRLITNLGEKAKLPGMEIAALAIKAWNAHRSGHHPRFLKWQTSDKAGAEPFPKVA